MFDPGIAPDVYSRREDVETSWGYGETGAPDKYSEAAYWFLVRNARPTGWTWYEVSKEIDLGQCPWHRFSDLARRRLIKRMYDEKGKLVKRAGGSNRPQAVWQLA